jgi:hypothetical protein
MLVVFNSCHSITTILTLQHSHYVCNFRSLSLYRV